MIVVYGVQQGVGNGFLANHILEGLGAIFSS